VAETASNDQLVDVATVAKKGSLIVLVICVFALFLYVTTGFIVIHPYFAALSILACGVFYTMGTVLERSRRNNLA